ncbi:MAG TPA: GntR family transcriptional regulator [Aliidongia sp.]|uniref:GntR family transcriptional regulator n=1 Tax=Aliidongia sp. TaxID=1914230 RepID=UPI002DDC90C3|nr:GntR family transcriptional regulator [Aliidongia sp.]HEV2675116.1 GntR family transcriptional regulator [Aliidongia sp.]
MSANPDLITVSEQTSDGAGSLAQIAYDRIFDAIQTGRLPPGTRVKEAELTAWLEMSRTPVRDALVRLGGEGLLRHEAYRGIVIASLDRQMVGELFLAREAMEGTAAALAARYAADAEIAALQSLLELERSVAGDPVAGARYNRKFHAEIYVCAHNRYLLTPLRALWSQMALVTRQTRRSQGRSDEARREHEAIVAAIVARDPVAAEAAARQHIKAAQQALLTDWIEGRP